MKIDKLNLQLFLCTSVALAWVAFGSWFSVDWFHDIASRVDYRLWIELYALYVIVFIALVPGFIQVFNYVGLLFHRRSNHGYVAATHGVSVLVAAFNEEGNIGRTIKSIINQSYRGPIEVFIIDDGSQDNTLGEIHYTLDNCFKEIRSNLTFHVIMQDNQGKAQALNNALVKTKHDIIITVDGDCELEVNAIKNLVEHKIANGYTACAGTVLVRNERESIWTRIQKWEYCLGIRQVKMVQGIFGCTSVCQGALSIYDKQALVDIGGWKRTVGEDIVLSWDLLARDHRTGHCDTSIGYTTVPATAYQLMNQRRRWARGMFEAIKSSPGIMKPVRRFSVFSWMNATFPFVDVAYILILPVWMVKAVFFGDNLIVGNYFYLVLATGFMLNIINYRMYVNLMRHLDDKATHDIVGFFIYTTVYGFFNQACSLVGYYDELSNPDNKRWLTK